MKQLYREYSWKMEIKWHRPVLYDKFIKEGSDHDYDSYFYMIIVKYDKPSTKLVYIGKTYYQLVSDHMKQRDHVEKYKKIRKKYPKHKIYVVCSEILPGDRITEKRVDETETLLIYGNHVDTLMNKSKLSYISIRDQYM